MSRARSSRVVPETYAGWARIASAIRAAAGSSAPDPSTPRASRRNARASPVSDAESSGAPQPSTAVTATGSPVSSAKVGRDRLLQRVVGVEVGVGRPAVDDTGGEHRGVLARAVHQHRRRSSRRRGSPAPGPRRRAGSPAASAGRPRTGPPPARIRRTPSTWNGSPECEAQASASRLGRQVEAGPDHAERLERLVARARQDRRRPRRRPTRPPCRRRSSATTEP